MNKNLEAALRYAAAGYACLPVWGLKGKHCACPKGAACEAPGKHPNGLMNWPRQASTDPAQIKRWFAAKPDAHVGVTPPEGCVVLDVDPRNGGMETLKALLGSAKLPKNTPVQESGGGGLHLVFAGEPRGPLGKGIDVKRHRRGYVVAYPARHMSGGAYSWRCTPWDAKPAPLPPQLQGGAASSGGTDDAREAVPLAEVERALAAMPADDYETWIAVGQALRHDYGAQGKDVWLAWSRKSDKHNDRDEQRWDTFDHNRGVKPLRSHSILAMARRSGYAPEFLPQGEPRKQAAPAIQVQPAADIASRDLPDVRVFVPKLITAGLTLVAGRAKLGKSWLMLDLARALSSGGQFLGQRAVKARVLYLALEDNERRMKKRIEKLGMRPADMTFAVSFTAARVDQGLTGQLCALIEKDGYEVIIIDTLAAISPSGHGRKGVWAGDYDSIATLQRDVAGRHNAAILIVTHTKKGADKVDAQDAVTSTSGILAGADAYWVFQRQSGGAGGEGRMVLTVRGRDIEEEEYAVRFDRDTTAWEMLGRAGQVVYSELQHSILDALRTNAKPMRHSELKLASALGANFNPSLARLVRRGLVEQDKLGRYTLASLDDILG